MTNGTFETPILFLIFNRPGIEKQVFDVIRKIKPKELYVAADGPREGNSDDIKRCARAKGIVDNGVGWDCRVHKLYRDKNLGCKLAVSSAIDWFFENVEEGIILEDDCLPDVSFFMFCAELLVKYKNDRRILIISGDNFQDEKVRGNGSYYFSKFTHIWGWATWKDRWTKYDVNIRDWPSVKANGGISFSSILAKKYWQFIFDEAYLNKIDTWDYQLLYLSMKGNYLNILPNVNIVKNIGFGAGATHTNGRVAGSKIGAIKFPLVNTDVVRSDRADRYTEKNIFGISVYSYLLNVFKKIKNEMQDL